MKHYFYTGKNGFVKSPNFIWFMRDWKDFIKKFYHFFPCGFIHSVFQSHLFFLTVPNHPVASRFYPGILCMKQGQRDCDVGLCSSLDSVSKKYFWLHRSVNVGPICSTSKQLCFFLGSSCWLRCYASWWEGVYDNLPWPTCCVQFTTTNSP